jgi:hypothetical protein
MRRILLAFTIFLFSITIFAGSNTIDRDRFNLMFNYSDSVDFIWESRTPTKPKIDSSEFIDSKHPIYFEADKYSIYDLYHFYRLKIDLFLY